MKKRNTKPATAASLPALLEYEGCIIHGRDEMLSLTDMWKAAGSPDARRPNDWLALSSTKEFQVAVEASFNAGKSGIIGERGRTGGTWAHWQIALAYAKYLSPEFHMWCNTVVRNHMEGRQEPANNNLALAAREARLFLKQALGIGKIAGLTGNQLLIAASRSTKRAVGFDMLDSMGISHLIAPANDPLIIPSEIGERLDGLSAVRVNHMLHEIGAQEGEHDHKNRLRWKPTAYGKELGGQMVDVDRSNSTGSAQQLKWPTGIVDVLRDHMKKAS